MTLSPRPLLVSTEQSQHSRPETVVLRRAPWHWTKKQWCMYTAEYYLAMKKNNPLTICSDTNGPGGFEADQSESDRKRQMPHDFTYTWTLKSEINEQTKRNQTHGHRDHFDGCQTGKGFEGWMKKTKRGRSTNWVISNSHGNIEHGIGNIVTNSIMTPCSAAGHRICRGIISLVT